MKELLEGSPFIEGYKPDREGKFTRTIQSITTHSSID
jgi:hypothetical protein